MSRTNDRVYLAQRAKLKVPGVRCELCGEEIDLTLPQYDDDSFQSDHLYPVGRDNDNRGPLIPMHRRCNLKKATKDLDAVRVDRHSRQHY